jgi:hypothetical protein
MPVAIFWLSIGAVLLMLGVAIVADKWLIDIGVVVLNVGAVYWALQGVTGRGVVGFGTRVLTDPEGNEFCLLKARLNPL